MTLRSQGSGGRAGCPFPGHSSAAIGTHRLAVLYFSLSSPGPSFLLSLPFLFPLSSLFLSPLNPNAAQVSHHLQGHQPRGSSTNICAHLHSRLLSFVYIVNHKRNNCFTIFVCSFQHLGRHCLFSVEPVTFSCSSCTLYNIFLSFPGHCE